jgi:hypothetical protein
MASEALLAHVLRSFAGRSLEREKGTAHVREILEHFEVLCLSPDDGSSEPFVYLSLGANEATRDEPTGVELVLLSAKKSPVHRDTLSTAAYYHCFYGLDVGKSLKVARGWLPDSTCDRLLVTSSGPLAPDLEWCEMGERRVRFLWLFPITRDEEQYLKEHGHDAFVAKLGEAGPDYLDPYRASVI